jgi:hypothetical protein
VVLPVLPGGQARTVWLLIGGDDMVVPAGPAAGVRMIPDL